MRQPLPLWVGLRFGGGRGGNRLVRFLSRLSTAGLVVAVALLIVVLSVMNGFEYEMRSRILSLVPHITVISNTPENLEQWQPTIAATPGVESVEAFGQFNGMLVKGRTVKAVGFYALATELGQTTPFDRYMQQPLAQQIAAHPNGVVVGAGLAKALQVEVGDPLALVTGAPSQSGRFQPTMQRLQVVGVLNSGTELDEAIALVSDQLLPAGALEYRLRVTTEDLFTAPRVAQLIAQQLPWSSYVRDWTQTHGNLYSAIELSKRLVLLMLVAVIAVAAFNVVSSLVLVVNDKQREIAILRTLGSSPRDVLLMFMVQGVKIGLIGTLLGAVAGVLLSLLITDLVALIEKGVGVQFLQADVYPLSYLPSHLQWQDIGVVCLVALVMSLLATLYPAWRAAHLQPAEILRYE